MRTITINDGHIRLGERGDCHTCPAALAIREACPELGTIVVTDFTVRFNVLGKSPEIFWMPRALIIWINRFDKFGPTGVQPISFEFPV